MPEAEVRINNYLGLHARAAGQVVRLAFRFKSRIRITRKDGTAAADANSMLSLLALGAARNTVIIINTEGEDADEALAAIVDLIESGFGEEF